MSIYIHIPFCDSICSYCDFCKVFYNSKLVDDYLIALSREIDLNYKNEFVDTLYIGGGTPSCLSIEQLTVLFRIIDKFNFDNGYEFTFECNIESINREKLEFLYNHGVNRLSIGVQTFNDKFLKFLNRNHTNDEVFNKIEMAKKIGFDNINIDLIYAIPCESVDDLNYDIDMFLSLGINHISTYSLILEEHTKLYVDGVSNIDDDTDRNMYDLICKRLSDNGYVHYEISNFCKEGYESSHNLAYWNNMNYYGFGCGASGYIDNVRYDNTRSLNKYILGNYRLNEDVLDKNIIIENEFILGFRKIKGINICDFNKKYGNIFYEVINRLIGEGKLINDGNNIYINPLYIYISNSILIDFIGEKYE
jgi:oxygen-independent coproporphyrinogen-3 oxidase